MIASSAVWLMADDDPKSAAAAALGVPTVARLPERGFYLRAETKGLTLHHARAPGKDAGLRIDLRADQARRRADARRSPLARACGLHRHAPMSVLDTTCGLGRDSAILAGLGCALIALERQPVLYALLADARERAIAAPGPPAWLARWRLEHADARRWLAEHPEAAFDLIYIDPMFPVARRKAAPQKALAWLGALVGGDRDAPALLAQARGRAGRRVVVKQHARARPLAPPDRQVRAKAVRFDIYLSGRRPRPGRILDSA